MRKIHKKTWENNPLGIPAPLCLCVALCLHSVEALNWCLLLVFDHMFSVCLCMFNILPPVETCQYQLINMHQLRWVV